MRNTAKQYTEALYEVIKDKGLVEQKKIIRNFLQLLKKRHVKASSNSMLRYFEKCYLKDHDMRKVEVESMNPLSDILKSDIKKSVGKQVLLYEKINPDLLAGIKMIVDNSLLIDASAKTKLAVLFKK